MKKFLTAAVLAACVTSSSAIAHDGPYQPDLAVGISHACLEAKHWDDIFAQDSKSGPILMGQYLKARHCNEWSGGDFLVTLVEKVRKRIGHADRPWRYDVWAVKPAFPMVHNGKPLTEFFALVLHTHKGDIR